MDEVNKAVNAMSFFNIDTGGMGLLTEMQSLSMLILYIGMVADLVVIMLVMIAILLIHSLLLISIEKKTFEFGVMRLTGLGSPGLITLIAI